jgi:hypothetical protein
MRSNEGLELGDERVLASEEEIRFDSRLERRQSELLQTRDLVLGEGLEGKVCEWRASPKCECLVKRGRSLLCITARELPPPSLQQSLEAACIQSLWPYAQHIAGGPPDQQLVAGSVGKKPPQPREIHVQDRVDRLRGSIPPELLYESLARDRLVRVYEKNA